MRQHLSTPRKAAIAAVTSALLVLTGCGSADSDASGSGTSSSSSSTSDASASPSSSSAELTKATIFRAAYDASIEAGSAHMVMSSTGASAISAEGDVSYSGGAPTMSMTMKAPQGGAGNMEIRMVEGIMYLQIPGVTPKGKFISFDPKDPNSQFAKSFGNLSSQVDPLASLKTMEKAVTDLKVVGQEKVDGVDTDHYRVTIDTKVLMKQLGQTQAVTGMPDTLTYDLWLDAKNLIHKMNFELAGTTIQMTMTDWGKPVKVQKPAPAQIVKAPTS